MSVWIVGSGAVGLIFGACLARQGQQVVFLCRRAVQADQLNTYPLEAEIEGESFSVAVSAALLPAVPAPKPDLIIFAQKSMGFEGDLKVLLPKIPADVPLLPMLNGVIHYTLLKQLAPQHRVWGGVTYVGARRLSDGKVKAEKRFRAVLGDDSTAPSSQLGHWAEILIASGIKTEVQCPVRDALWQKQIFLTVQNALSSLTNLTFGQMGASADALWIAEQLQHEVCAVARAEGIAVDDDVMARIRKNWEFIGGHYASMRHDFISGQPTEIEAAQGTIIRLGEQHGIPTPACRMLYHLIRAAESKIGKDSL